jgi:hypothetical protein
MTYIAAHSPTWSVLTLAHMQYKLLRHFVIICFQVCSTHRVVGHVLELGLYEPASEEVVVVGREHVHHLGIETQVVSQLSVLLTHSKRGR